MTAIIDYDAGNIKSVEKALLFLGEETCVTREKEEILSADKVILPGVGSFGKAMEKIRGYGLEEIIKETISQGTPFLGICLGLQLLFERSDESEGVSGLVGRDPGRSLCVFCSFLLFESGGRGNCYCYHGVSYIDSRIGREGQCFCLPVPS